MEKVTDLIKENVQDVRKRLDQSARRAGRDSSEITLVAVSKTFKGELIRQAYNLGIDNFGENYIQEAIPKIKKVDLPVRWHFLGHLQGNKVRKAVRNFDMIQSVDSVKLVKRIDRIAGEEEKVIEALIQVNLVGEEQKGGVKPDEIENLLQAAASCKNIKLMGLMLLPPFYDNPERNRKNFSALRQLMGKIDKMDYPNWQGRYLSMGMTDDFEIAIEEGSNMVRIGRAIFGPRRRK